MCRLVIFSGACTTCGEEQIWEDLTQQLSCLEAKNNGIFGDCSKGVYQEQHHFDQECDQCNEEDEGIGDIEEMGAEAEPGLVAHGKRGASQERSTSSRKKAKT